MATLPTARDLLLDTTPDSAWIRARGADVDSFLQGQLSNDLRALEPGRAQLSSYNSPKGRMLAVLTLLRSADGGVDIELARELLEPVLKRLRLFVLRAKVTLAAGDERSLGLVGAGAADTLRALGLPVPARPLDWVEARGLRVLRRFGAEPRYSLIGSAEALAALGSVPATGTGLDPWARARIRAGEPVVVAATQDHFVAQMANLDELGGISFTKGCYTGQEIVARLHYLGQLKRRLFVCRGHGPLPAPGHDVHVDGQDQAVGEIVEAAADGDGEGDGFIASLVLQLGQSGATALRTGDSRLETPGPGQPGLDAP